MSDPYYDEGYHARRHKALIEDEEYFRARAEASARFYFAPAELGVRVFEYGCGIGQGIAALPNAAGWDVSSEAREACRRRGLRVFDRLEDIPPAAWDIVFCRHVLEHVEDPLDALRAMRGLVAGGGELRLILPREGHAAASFDPDLDQHLYCWNFRAANNLLRRAGFAPFANEEKYILGYRALLPLRRALGPGVYYHAARLVGRLYGNGELLIRARPF